MASRSGYHRQHQCWSKITPLFFITCLSTVTILTHLIAWDILRWPTNINSIRRLPVINIIIDSITSNKYIKTESSQLSRATTQKERNAKFRKRAASENTKRRLPKQNSKGFKTKGTSRPSSQPSPLKQTKIDQEMDTEALSTRTLSAFPSAQPSSKPPVPPTHRFANFYPSQAPSMISVPSALPSHTPTSSDQMRLEEKIDNEVLFFDTRLLSKLPTPFPSPQPSHVTSDSPTDHISSSIPSIAPSVSSEPPALLSHNLTLSIGNNGSMMPSNSAMQSMKPTTPLDTHSNVLLPDTPDALLKTTVTMSPSASPKSLKVFTSIPTQITRSISLVPSRTAGQKVVSSSEPTTLQAAPTTAKSNIPTKLRSLVPTAAEVEQRQRHSNDLSPPPISDMDQVSSAVDDFGLNISSLCSEASLGISVISVLVEFEYVLQYSSGSDVKEILHDIEKYLHKYIVERYLNCQVVTFGTVRKMQMSYNSTDDLPVGFNTSPIDEIKEGDSCSVPISAGTNCDIIKGGFTILLQNTTRNNFEELRRRCFDTSKYFMEQQLRNNFQSNISGLSFCEGALSYHPLSSGVSVNDKSKNSKDFDPLAQNKNQRNDNSPRIVTTLVTSACSLVAFFGFVFIIPRRRKRRRHQTRETFNNDFDFGDHSDIFSSEDGLSSVGISFTVHAEEASSRPGQERHDEHTPPYPSLFYCNNIYLNNTVHKNNNNLSDLSQTSDISPISDQRTPMSNGMTSNQLFSMGFDWSESRVQPSWDPCDSSPRRYASEGNIQFNCLALNDDMWDDEANLPPLI